MKKLTLAAMVFSLLGTTVISGQTIEGDWSVTKGVVAGLDVPIEILASMKLKITGNQFDASSDGTTSKGMIKVESRGRGPTKAVFAIDTGDDAGRQINAIYQMAGRTLKIAFSQTADFPANFDSTEANKIVSLVYRNINAPPANRRNVRSRPRATLEQVTPSSQSK